MSNKKHRLTHTQLLGIIWFSIALLLIICISFFSSRQPNTEPQQSEIQLENCKKLTNLEDSVYRSRRKGNRQYTKQKSTNRQYIAPDSIVIHDHKPVYHRQPLVVELNSADTVTLQLLNGIGPTFARRIIAYRERLGGYVSKEQLLEVYGFTPSLLEHISPYLELDTANLRHIPINTLELKQLIKHPYIEYYQARDIVRLRNRGFVFNTPDDLRSIPSMSDSTMNRLLPYLDFSTK